MNIKAAGIRKALYSLGAEPLTIPMVRVRKHTRLSRRGCVSTLTIHMVRVRKHTRLSRTFRCSTIRTFRCSTLRERERRGVAHSFIWVRGI